MFAGDLRVDETGKPINPIYDPATTRVENGKVVRDPFPNNIIPTNRLDPIMQSYIKLFYPAPNLPGQTSKPDQRAVEYSGLEPVYRSS